MSEQHNYRLLTPVGWFTCDTQERLEQEIKHCTEEVRAEFYQPGIGWVRYNPQPVDYAAIIKQCFGEIEAKRKFAIDQRQQCDDWEYEYYDGMVNAYARAMAILEERITGFISEANARLIAAAPELLEALEKIRSDPDIRYRVWVKAHEAIKKARGE